MLTLLSRALQSRTKDGHLLIRTLCQRALIFRTVIEDLSLLFYADLVHAGARLRALSSVALMCHRAVRSAVVRDKAFRQRCARICSLHSHSRFVCRSPFLRPSHCTSHSPRPLQSPRITNRPKCAALFSRPLAFDLGFYEGDAHFFRAARWAVRWISQTTYAFRVFFVPTTSQFGWSDACFGWLQGVLAVTSASSTLDHRNDHNQTAEPTGPERERVGMLAAFLHEISLSTPRVVAGPPILSVL